MNIADWVILIWVISNLFLVGVLLYLVYKLFLTTADKRVSGVADELEDEEVNKYLSDAELERMAWRKEFDARIAELRYELDMDYDDVLKYGSGTPAEELHPQVKNLPHSAVNAKPTYLPDVEVAD